MAHSSDEDQVGDPIPLLLRESHIDPGAPYRVPPQFQVKAPQRLKADEEWDWRTLTHALIHATRLFEDGGPKNASLYLERTFPGDFSVSGLAPLAAEALAEIVNLWGACYRRRGELASAIDLFDTALRLTRRASIRQYAHYNRGYTRLQMAMLASANRSGDVPTRRVMKQLVGAENDLAIATELNPTDSAAWSQRGLAALLLGSISSMTIGKRLRWHRSASKSYENALEHEPEEDERTTIENNLAVARQGLAALSKYSWLQRTFGRSAEHPSSMDEVDAFAESRGAEHDAASLDLLARAEHVINRPVEEEDDGQRERDPRIVAERLIRAFDARSGEAAGKPAFAFVEATEDTNPRSAHAGHACKRQLGRAPDPGGINRRDVARLAMDARRWPRRSAFSDRAG